MIGVQAISGGLLGLALLVALALSGAGALVGGSVLAYKRRRASGFLLASLGAALLVGIGIVAVPMFPSSIGRHVIDLTSSPHAGLREPPAQCAPIGSEEWCSMSKKVRDLALVLPRGERRSMGTASLHAVFLGGELKKLAFMVEPSPNGEQLASLLALEAKAAGGAADAKAAEQALWRVRSNEVVQHDQHVFFAHPGYKVHVWLLPRHSSQDTYGVWYEVMGEAPGATISSSTGDERSNRSFDTDTLRQGAASRASENTSRGALPQRAGQLQR